MNKIKKILAVVLTMAMMMAISLVSFAAEPAATATATVKGVSEDGAVVTAYQLVTYNANGNYEVVEAAKNKGYTVGSADASVVASLAADTTGLASTVLAKQGNGDYTATLAPGTYLVLVTGAGSTIYNPMLVSIEVEYPGGAQEGEVDADTNYVVNDTVAYAKSTTSVPVDKQIIDEEGNVIGENGKYEDVYAGTTVYFTLTGTIPSYSASYENITYKLTDTASAGLTLGEDVKSIIENQLDSDAAEVTVSGNTITIAFNRDYILENGNKEIKITYPATVNGTASNFNPATNTLNVEYSNSPSSTATGTPVETKHYTFNLDGALIKVDSENQETKLDGAVFTLTSTTDSTKVFTSTSDENGNIAFAGLDAGTYTLEETKAPSGYSLSGKTYTVTIDPTYEGDTLTSYSVKIMDGDEAIGNLTYTEDGHTGNAANIVNTTLAELPSTGGIGTTIFTIAGCAIMIAAAGIFFVSRRKTEK